MAACSRGSRFTVLSVSDIPCSCREIYVFRRGHVVLEKQGSLFRRIGLGRQGTGFHTSGSPILQPIQDQREHDCRTKSTPSQKIACLEAVLNLSPKAHTKTNTSSQEKLFGEIQNSFLFFRLFPDGNLIPFPRCFSPAIAAGAGQAGA